jgi:hypothetical protein
LARRLFFRLLARRLFFRLLARRLFFRLFFLFFRVTWFILLCFRLRFFLRPPLWASSR